jgi:hypothetical protein
MIPSYIIKQDRETFTVLAGVGFEAQLNSDELSVDRQMSKSELLYTTLHDRLDEWIDQFIEEVEI